MTTYSFMSVAATIDGPGGSIPLGYGAEAAEEGITISMIEDKNTMMIGADGGGMHSLHAGRAATITVRLLKTSPVNAQLMNMYNYQSSGPAYHGRNTISIADVARGDTITAQGCAFRKAPDLTYAKNGNTHEWVFDAIRVGQTLGASL